MYMCVVHTLHYFLVGFCSRRFASVVNFSVGTRGETPFLVASVFFPMSAICMRLYKDHVYKVFRKLVASSLGRIGTVYREPCIPTTVCYCSSHNNTTDESEMGFHNTSASARNLDYILLRMSATFVLVIPSVPVRS